MHEENIMCKVRHHKYNSYKGQTGKIVPNLLQRDFSTTKSNEKRVQILHSSICLEQSFIFPQFLIYMTSH